MQGIKSGCVPEEIGQLYEVDRVCEVCRLVSYVECVKWVRHEVCMLRLAYRVSHPQNTNCRFAQKNPKD